MQRRPNVFDVGPTLYKCYTNVLCLLGWYNDLHVLNTGRYAMRVEGGQQKVPTIDASKVFKLK